MDAIRLLPMPPIAPDWLDRSALDVAPDLLGCLLVRQFADGTIRRGIIVETEAYTEGDPAMHAYQKRTARNSILFGAAGVSYVYLIYGMYHCLNVVTDRAGTPSAVLIRALELDSIPEWLNVKSIKLAKVAAGPGKLCRALQIDLSLTAQPFRPGNPLGLEHRSEDFQRSIEQGTTAFVQTTRIGLTRGADLPWRWYIKNHPSISKP